MLYIQTSRETRSIVPLWIKQLNTCTEYINGDFLLDGTKLWLICVFGYIESIEDNQQRKKFTINDGSGSIDAVLWKDNKKSDSSTAVIRYGILFFVSCYMSLYCNSFIIFII